LGKVPNARLEAVLSFWIEDSSGHLHLVEPVIDTGFNGDLTLPIAQVSALGLSFRSRIVSQLANGSLQTIDAHSAILHWDMNLVQIRVQAVGTTPLLGTRLMAGHELKVQFVPGGAVTLERIP
jgi:predicted aspartyl protease